MTIKYPKKISKNAKVGICSIDGSIISNSDIKMFNQGVSFYKNLGLDVLFDESIFDSWYYTSAHAEEKLANLYKYFEDESIEAVIIANGGKTTNDVLSKIDFKIISQNPKPILGFSGPTCLLNAIFFEASMVTYYGFDILWTAGQGLNKQSVESLSAALFGPKFKSLTSKDKFESYDPVSDDSNKDYINKWKVLKNVNELVKVSGRVIGGHSTNFCSALLSYPKWNLSNTVLFFELFGKIDAIHRELRSIEVRGEFNNINALVIGWAEDCYYEEDERNMPLDELLIEVTQGYDFPILRINSFGHNIHNQLIPIGSFAEIDLKNMKIDFS